MSAADALAAVAVEALETVEVLEVRRLLIPLRRAHVAAHGTEAVRDLLVIGVSGAGHTGWGECSALATPGYTSECTQGAFDQLRLELVPELVAGGLTGALAGGEPLDPLAPMASAAVESALIDLGLRQTDRSLVGVLGRAVGVLPRCQVLASAVGVGPGSGDGDDLLVAPLLEAVAGAVGSGAEMVKLKVGPTGGVAAVVAVRRQFAELRLAVDANGSLEGCDEVLTALGELDLAYVEQPLPPDHPDAAAVAHRLGVPVALDESITGLDALRRCLAAGEGTIVNLKPARVGGLSVAVRCWEAAVAAGAGVFVGGMLESAVGRAAAAALAGAVGSGVGALPTDLGPSSQYFDVDVAGPVVVDHDGRLRVPTGTGTGVTPDPAVLDALTADRWEHRW